MPLKYRASMLLGAIIAINLLVGLHPSSLADEPGGSWWWPTQGEWVETEALSPPDVDDPQTQLTFGTRLAIDGDTLVVSTQGNHQRDRGTSWCEEDERTGCDWVYVFQRSHDGRWDQYQKLVPSDAQVGDSYGASVALDEESGIIVIGNPGHSSKTDTIYIFERNTDGLWFESQKIKKDYPEPPNQKYPGDTSFGISVAVDGQTVVAADIWSVYVFEREGSSWAETAALEGSAHGLAIAGDTLITTPISHDPRECGQSKRVIIQIHNRSAGEWNVVATLDPQQDFGNRSQTSIGRITMNEDGTTLVVGSASDRRIYGFHTQYCIENDGIGPVGPFSVSTSAAWGGSVGSVWVYEFVDDQWVMTADIPNPMPQSGYIAGGSVFGASIGVSGDSLVVGAYGDSYNGGMRSGAAYVYDKMNGKWSLQAKLRNHDSDSLDYFGISTAISGSTIAVGADWNTRTGTVHTFDRSLLDTAKETLK